MPPDLIHMLIGSIDEVFAVMLHRSIQVHPARLAGTTSPPCDVLGTVGLTGPTHGLVAVYASAQVARSLAASFLSTSPAEVSDGDVVDAFGEFTNLIAGTFRTKTSERQPWVMAVPMVVTGTGLSSKHLDHGEHVLLALTSEGDQLFVELVLSRSATEAAA